jgi:hypothetical protein
LPHGTIMVPCRVRGGALVSCGTRDRSPSERGRDLRVVGEDVMARSTAATLRLCLQCDLDSAERVSPASVFVGTRTDTRRSTTDVSEAGVGGHDAGLRINQAGPTHNPPCGRSRARRASPPGVSLRNATFMAQEWARHREVKAPSSALWRPSAVR